MAIVGIDSLGHQRYGPESDKKIDHKFVVWIACWVRCVFKRQAGRGLGSRSGAYSEANNLTLPMQSDRALQRQLDGALGLNESTQEDALKRAKGVPATLV